VKSDWSVVVLHHFGLSRIFGKGCELHVSVFIAVCLLVHTAGGLL